MVKPKTNRKRFASFVTAFCLALAAWTAMVPNPAQFDARNNPADAAISARVPHGSSTALRGSNRMRAEASVRRRAIDLFIQPRPAVEPQVIAGIITFQRRTQNPVGVAYNPHGRSPPVLLYPR